jgi:hypothetical protein
MINTVVTLVLFTGVVAHPSPLQSTCPLRVDAVHEYGLALKVALHNKADYAVRLKVLHVTFADGLGKYHERAYRFNVLVQPYQDITVTTPSLKAVVNWSTVGAYATCRPLTDEEDD